MLAKRDAVVAPTTAAAVLNSIDADPGRKWRFLIEQGHHDGDTGVNRRIAMYRRALCDFFDPEMRPIQSMKRWEACMHGGTELPSGVEDEE